MNLQKTVEADVRRRAGLLPDEVSRWQEITEANQDGMGIHRSQVRAVYLQLKEKLAELNTLLAELGAAPTPQEFAERRAELELERTVSDGIAAVFRHILAQRDETQGYRDVLDAADLVAADCYSRVITTALGWGVVKENELRVPPLTYLNARPAPEAITRRHTFGSFEMSLDANLDLPIPINVISLPFHDTTAVWSYCSLYHEVGHPLDVDLALSGLATGDLPDTEVGLSTALRPHLKQALKASERAPIWADWLREMVADVFGVLLGGAAYAHSLAELLFQPLGDVTVPSAGSEHPTPYVRIFLVGAILRRTGVPALATVAGEIEEQWKALYGEPASLTALVTALVKECPTVAKALLDQKLPELKGRRLRDFGAGLANEHEQISRLATCFRLGIDCPDPTATAVRHIPAAAQLAVHAVTQGHAAKFEQIQRDALAFFKLMDRPQFLATPDDIPTVRQDFLSRLAHNFTSAALKR